jgi:hypothetical protein
MDTVTREQFKALRLQGYTAENIQDFAKRGRITEKLNGNKTFQEKGLLRSAADFLNLDEFGRGIGQTIYNMTGEGKRTQENILQLQEQNINSSVNALRDARARGDEKAVANLTQNLQKVSQEQNVDFDKLATGGLNNREVLGSAASTALNVASLGGALNLAGKAATGASTIGQAALRGAGQGAISGGLFGAAESMTEGEGVATGAAKGAAYGAVVGGVLGGASKYIDDLIKTTPESRLFETKDAFKTLKRRFNDNSVIQGKGEARKVLSDPITTLTSSGMGKQLRVIDGKINTEQARTGLRTMINELDDQVAEAVTSSQATAKLSLLKQKAVDAIKANESLKASGKVQKTVAALDSYFDDFTQSYGDEVSMETASQIRQQMNKAWNPDTVDVERAVGDTMRKVIYKNVPGAQQTLTKEGQLIAADKFLDALDGRAVKGGRLGGYFANLLGAMVGSSTNIPVAGPLVGALGANQIQQLMQQQQLNPLLPRVARGIASIVDRLPADAAGNVSKTAVLNLIGQLSAQSTSGQTETNTALGIQE